MNSRLEQFIQDHRDEFDADEPGKDTLEKILQRVDKDQLPQTETASPGPTVLDRFLLNFAQLSIAARSAAAAILLLAVAVTWYISRSVAHHGPTGIVASMPSGAGSAAGSATTAKPPLASSNPPAAGEGTKKDSRTEYAEDYTEEMYHYTKLVEIKHRELKLIDKDEPLLYRQFAGDVSKLDSVYHTLEKQLPKNPNREQLLEAMIQNLQLQTGLLNHQLEIIKKINHSKKTAYEKAYKTT